MVRCDLAGERGSRSVSITTRKLRANITPLYKVEHFTVVDNRKEPEPQPKAKPKPKAKSSSKKSTSRGKRPTNGKQSSLKNAPYFREDKEEWLGVCQGKLGEYCVLTELEMCV